MKLLLTGGGTGGHIYPALAVAKDYKKNDPAVDILYVGTKRGLENDIVPRAGFAFRTIDVMGLKRSMSFDTLKTFWLLLKGLGQARKIIREFQPDLVIGTGGYVCAPVLFMARLMGCKTMIHEQNVFPGLTNRFLSRWVHRICISFPEAERYFPKAGHKVVLTGNPRASEVVRVDPERARKVAAALGLSPARKTVVVVSGSRGARPINEAVLQMLPKVANQRRFQLLYITGQIHYEAIQQRMRDMGVQTAETIIVRPFVYEMPELLSLTDLMVGRAGATTIAELTAMGVPAVFIPSPYVTANHQELNARWVVDHGGAVMLREAELSGERLWQTIQPLIFDDERLQAMRQSSRALGIPDALARVEHAVHELLAERKT